MYDCDIDWYMIIWWNQLLVSSYYNSFCGFSLHGKLRMFQLVSLHTFCRSAQSAKKAWGPQSISIIVTWGRAPAPPRRMPSLILVLELSHTRCSTRIGPSSQRCGRRPCSPASAGWGRRRGVSRPPPAARRRSAWDKGLFKLIARSPWEPSILPI